MGLLVTARAQGFEITEPVAFIRDAKISQGQDMVNFDSAVIAPTVDAPILVSIKNDAADETPVSGVGPIVSPYPARMLAAVQSKLCPPKRRVRVRAKGALAADVRASAGESCPAPGTYQLQSITSCWPGAMRSASLRAIVGILGWESLEAPTTMAASSRLPPLTFAPSPSLVAVARAIEAAVSPRPECRAAPLADCVLIQVAVPFHSQRYCTSKGLLPPGCHPPDGRRRWHPSVGSRRERRREAGGPVVRQRPAALQEA